MHSILLKRNTARPLYMQIYDYFKTAIERGEMEHGEKLPSIRALAQTLSVSKITVEMAYAQLLSEGYIENANRARYTAAKVEPLFPEGSTGRTPDFVFEEKKTVRYDFSSGEMDPQGFSFSLWRRYLGAALADSGRLMRYGDAQGEAELREQIAKYIRTARGVDAHPAQIVIASGVQQLLGALCILLKQEYGDIAFEEPGFRKGRQVFAHHGFRVHPAPMKQDGIDIAQLRQSGARLAYVSPSHQFPTGSIMPAGKRARLLSWAQEVQGLIIEDDYDSEFRYYGHPIPALKGMDQGERVIYIGSFSKIMPPSIRISYMVLPAPLTALLLADGMLYNQSASTYEQLALARFMRDGEMEKQIRRLRGRYQEKRQRFLAAIREHFPQTRLRDTDSGLFTPLELRTGLSGQALKSRALAQDCRVALVNDFFLTPPPEGETKQIILYFSSIPLEEIDAAVAALANAWKEEKQ